VRFRSIRLCHNKTRVPKTSAKKPSAKRAVKLRIPRNAVLARFFLRPSGRILMGAFALLVIVGIGTFTYFYATYSRMIDEKLAAGPFAKSARIFAAPETVGIGDVLTPTDIAIRLRRSGYTESRTNSAGYYQLHPDRIEVFPGPESYFEREAGAIKFDKGKISQIFSLRDNTPRSQYQLEPQLITNLSGSSREKRRIVKFHDIPTVVVQAVISAEDKRFFQHAGFDPIRIIKAAYVDIREGRKDQGASTLSMQLARMFWLYQDKFWKRKFAEVMITLHLEQRLSKEQIFEDYANQIDLGWRGTFNIRGFAQAAEVYLGKELSQVTLPEAAELAGLAKGPGYFDPYRHPDRLKERRNVVLALMRQNGFVTDRDYALAIQTPLTVAKGAAQSVEAPYFVDLVTDTLQTRFQNADLHSNAFRVYTTLDMNLQRAAVDAIRDGMQKVDALIKKQRRFRGKPVPEPQVALVALDPHSGEVKALAGGRNYGLSQLNRVLRKRQPGSIFKPFVYAAALDTAVEGGGNILTPSSMVTDQPTTFYYDGQEYTPHNFKNQSFGDIPIRFALAHSVNIATVKIAEMVGYAAVVDMANRAGMNYKIQPTPAVALGAYEITPVEAAGAYTIFANEGNYVKPSFVRLVRGQDGSALFRHQPEEKQVLDPRVSYLMTNLMEEVIRAGTAAGVKNQYKLNFPLAGKTGTSRDGWFAGYSSELLCIVWVGFDDNTDLDLEGAHSAAPIWAQFMQSAMKFREYRDTKPFRAPDGIVSIDIDPASGMPATAACPTTRTEVYISGSQPLGSCPLHGGGRMVTHVSGWETTPPQPAPAVAAPVEAQPRIIGSGSDGLQPATPGRRASRQEAGETAEAKESAQPQEEPKKEKKSLFRRLIGVFK
jgi:penicillin-binding protein 1B